MGGLISLYLLGRDLVTNFLPIKINKIVLRSPVLDVKPLMVFLPTTLNYLKYAKIINAIDIKKLLKDVEVLNPLQYYSLIQKQNKIKIWGVIGKNDEVLQAEEMINAVKNFSKINVELWNNFPHNNIDDYLYDLYFNKLQEFMTD